MEGNNRHKVKKRATHLRRKAGGHDYPLQMRKVQETRMHVSGITASIL